MKGLAINTENRMQFKDFSEPLLDSLQKEVGGYIEVVSTPSICRRVSAWWLMTRGD